MDLLPRVVFEPSKDKSSLGFDVRVADIREVKKIGGLGWKSKLIVGLATGAEIAGDFIALDALACS